jgi:phosphoribosyl 1,2-cyclic phosphodiesterase
MPPETMPVLSVTFWGTRGSISTAGLATARFGGSTPCIQVSAGGQHVILDAGTGIRPLGKLLAQTERGKEHHIFLSHTHWDHIQGIPFFQPAYDADNTIYFYGSPKKERLLENILTGQMNQNYFPVQMKDLPAQIVFSELQHNPVRVGEMEISFQEQIYHPGGSLRFRVRAGNRAVVYATDVELDGIQHAQQGSAEAADYAAYVDFIRNADLLIADAQYSRETYASHQGWGHSSIETIIESACLAGVKQLALSHHDPDKTDDEIEALERSYLGTAPNMNIYWAREGSTITL